MRDADFGHSDTDTEFGRERLAGVQEVLAYMRGEIDLPGRVIETMPATRVKEIRRKVAKSPKAFERRFHIPARTLQGWEQGPPRPGRGGAGCC